MDTIPMETPIEQYEEEPPDNKIFPQSNESCSDSQDQNPSNFNRELESKQIVLITLVSQEPAIFNSKHDDYRNIPKKDELWLAMSKQVGWPDIYCKNKWKAIRDQYCRELKRTRANSNAKIKWKYFKHLEFLRPYALARNYRTKTNKKQVNSQSSIGYQEESSSNTQEESSIKTEHDINSRIKTEDWSLCGDNSDFLNENGDITSQIIMQLSQQSSGELQQELQDDDDDDPIHTFLNIESYFEKELITLVYKTPFLYDFSHFNYRNTKTKVAAWEEIARKLKRTVRQCRLKWKALRDQFIREHKRLKNVVFCKNLPRWKHYDAMCFLEPFVRDRIEQNPNTSLSEIPIQSFEEEDMINFPNEIEGGTTNDMTHYNILAGDDDTSRMYSERLYSPKQSTDCQQEKLECNQGEKTNHLVIEQITEVTEAQSSSIDMEIDDEVGAFFKAVAMKIRKANMSAVAFTDLQIDILKVITNALKD
ncbi:uncharacterized protein LOC129918962 [Episyrphus balteatus]|uniref:uncharacterized protein LOC129918962 n=1 Tax=Episyrphus balteatus TaxID=286459 RepID=UPI002485AAA2|nr:uncharacterized protein LOC129918962 [Episyrphus balteatus]